MTASKPNGYDSQESSGESHVVHTDEEHQSLIRVEFSDGSTDLFVTFQIDPTGNWVKLETESDNVTVPREQVKSITEAF